VSFPDSLSNYRGLKTTETGKARSKHRGLNFKYDMAFPYMQ